MSDDLNTVQRPSLPGDIRSRSRDPALALEQAWRDAEAALGVVLSVHDLTGAFRGGAGGSLLAPDRCIHAHPYCQRLHDQRCVDHCLHGVNGALAQRPSVQVHACWKGCQEVAVPLLRDGVHLATVFVGVFRGPEPAAALPADLERARARLPRRSPGALRALGRTVALIARGQLDLIDEWRRSAEADQGDRAARIRRFIRHRAQEPLRLDDLARHLGISPSRASHVVREQCGCSFQALVRQERLEAGRALLATSTRSVAAIAELVGYASVQHFNRAFRVAYGFPPGRWRRQATPS